MIIKKYSLIETDLTNALFVRRVLLIIWIILIFAVVFIKIINGFDNITMFIYKIIFSTIIVIVIPNFIKKYKKIGTISFFSEHIFIESPNEKFKLNFDLIDEFKIIYRAPKGEISPLSFFFGTWILDFKSGAKNYFFIKTKEFSMFLEFLSIDSMDLDYFKRFLKRINSSEKIGELLEFSNENVLRFKERITTANTQYSKWRVIS